MALASPGNGPKAASFVTFDLDDTSNISTSSLTHFGHFFFRFSELF